MNGHLRTGKLLKINKQIDWLNTNTDLPRIIKHEIDTSPLLSNAWFAGFFSCDGCFSATVRTKTSNPNSRDGVKVYLEVSQSQVHAQTGVANYDFMNRIAVELAGKSTELKEIKANTTNSASKSSPNVFNSRAKYYVRIHNQANIKIMMDYFSTYPVFNSKYLDYQDFACLFYLILNKEFSVRKHGLTNFPKARNIIKGMNSTRFEYNWDFLWSFSYYYPITFKSDDQSDNSN